MTPKKKLTRSGLGHRAVATLPALAVLLCCSCATPPSTTRLDPFASPAGTAVVELEASESAGAGGLSDDLVRTAAAGSTAGRPGPEPRAAASPVEQVSAETRAAPDGEADSAPVRTAGATASPKQGPYCPPQLDHLAPAAPARPVFQPAQPRQPVALGDEFEHMAEAFPDEYLCDGGDRALPVHYDQFNRNGLDTEDAVVEYVDEAGEFHVKPTNRVCVYAPRFGAVVAVGTAEERQNAEQLSLTRDSRGGLAMRQRTGSVQHAQRDSGVGVRVRSRASGLDTDVRGAGIDQSTQVSIHEKLLNGFENISFLRSGIFEQEEKPVLANRIQAAAAWSHDAYPVVTASASGPNQVEARFEPQALVGVEDESKPADLRIVKLADKRTALPGETVKFTIRYDNLGGRSLHYVTIVDNLTPRLEYVDDSADSDRAGRLVVEDNGEGSLVLKFEIDEEIKGGEGGVVSFAARVR